MFFDKLARKFIFSCRHWKLKCTRDTTHGRDCDHSTSRCNLATAKLNQQFLCGRWKEEEAEEKKKRRKFQQKKFWCKLACQNVKDFNYFYMETWSPPTSHCNLVTNILFKTQPSSRPLEFKELTSSKTPWSSNIFCSKALSLETFPLTTRDPTFSSRWYFNTLCMGTTSRSCSLNFPSCTFIVHSCNTSIRVSSWESAKCDAMLRSHATMRSIVSGLIFFFHVGDKVDLFRRGVWTQCWLWKLLNENIPLGSHPVEEHDGPSLASYRDTAFVPVTPLTRVP